MSARVITSISRPQVHLTVTITRDLFVLYSGFYPTQAHICEVIMSIRERYSVWLALGLLVASVQVAHSNQEDPIVGVWECIATRADSSIFFVYMVYHADKIWSASSASDLFGSGFSSRGGLQGVAIGRRATPGAYGSDRSHHCLRSRPAPWFPVPSPGPTAVSRSGNCPIPSRRARDNQRPRHLQPVMKGSR